MPSSLTQSPVPPSLSLLVRPTCLTVAVHRSNMATSTTIVHFQRGPQAMPRLGRVWQGSAGSMKPFALVAPNVLHITVESRIWSPCSHEQQVQKSAKA
jgi:hypothetical protein